MEIRRACSSDIPGILHLLHQVIRIHADIRPDLFKGEGSKYTAEQLEKKLEDSGEIILVCVDGEGTVKGYVFGVSEQTEETSGTYAHKTIYIDDLCVDENVRKEHIGTKLYQSMCEYAKSHGYDRITLHVWQGNSPAQTFYQSMGMRPMYTAMEQTL